METLNVRLEKRIIYKKKEKNLISVLIFENMSLPPSKIVSLIIKSGAMRVSMAMVVVTLLLLRFRLSI